MQRVRVIHWKPAEAEPLLEVCLAAGFVVEFEAGDLPVMARAVLRTLPDATFCNRTRVPAAIRAAIRNPVAVPVAPPTVMERYGSRTTAQKLGITEGMTVALLDAPRDYATVLGALPDKVELSEDSEGIHAVTLWFVRDPRAYQSELSRTRRLASRSKLRVIWRKDYKICSVDAQWSRILFAVRKS